MVYRFKDENGEIYYTDDYFIIAKKDEYSEYLKTIIDQYYDEYRFIFYFPWNIEGKTSLDQNISFDEFQKYADEHLVLCVQFAHLYEIENAFLNHQRHRYTKVACLPSQSL